MMSVPMISDAVPMMSDAVPMLPDFGCFALTGKGLLLVTAPGRLLHAHSLLADPQFARLLILIDRWDRPKFNIWQV